MDSIKRYDKNMKAHYYVFFVVFLCGLAISYFLYMGALKQVATEQKNTSAYFTEKLTNQLNQYKSGLTSVVALMESSESLVSPERFARFVQSLKGASYLHVYFAQYVSADDKVAYEAQSKTMLGRRSYAIYPVGDRAEYMPLALAYPDKILYGYDILSPQYRDHKSVAQSRNSFSIQLSEPTFTPFLESSDRVANNFVLRAPVYLSADSNLQATADAVGFYGVVGAYFSVDELLRKVVPLIDKDLFYRLADVTNNSPVWFADSAVGKGWKEGDFDSHYLNIAGRKWRVDTQYISGLKAHLPWFFIVSPLIVFTLLGLFLSSYMRGLSRTSQSLWRILNKRIEVDELTGLLTRYQIQQELNVLIEGCKGRNRKIAVMMLNLDHFKTINDAFGHEVGDALLIKVSERLASILPENTLAGYLGGDAFLVLFTQPEKRPLPRLDAISKDFIHKISQSYYVDGLTLDIGCSIGVALYPEFGSDAVTLVKNADMAVYQAKSAGRATYYFYDGEMGRRFARNVRIETRLRRAIQDEKLELHFQPKVDLVSEHCVGMEALLRWHDEELGSVSPAEFIPIAEQTGIILPLGDWVFEQAFKHMQEWKQQGINVPPIAINCSAAQLKRSDFLSKLLVLLDTYDIDPSLLEIEVTESILIEDAATCAELLNQMSRLGMKLAIDDFGTGYSSLSYLKDLPFDCVKIDLVFIRDVIENESHAALTKAIISLSHNLGLKVVAEGISHVDQLHLLREYGCDIGQGYLFSKALGATSMISDPMIVALNQQEKDQSDNTPD
ncbi:EAL domain-containing protein [Marinomonas sp. A79]|uniref:EAL domain-containing protein n=1 Tax=Marinomonas vulgaris TaxID=2823372 RepID=A0ABS5HC63_9GAMM|nr:EAL domain-containing protein [Marinomonas vulgaris]MBR7889052.1 EAL domain-containing protein [Marinomonas vulgaris]